MTREKLLQRVVSNRKIGGGQPCIRGTRIYVAVILDALAEGLTADAIVRHYPALKKADIQAAVAYAAELARENVWKVAAS